MVIRTALHDLFFEKCIPYALATPILFPKNPSPFHMESYHDSKCSYITKIARLTRYCQDCQLEVIARYLRNLDTA